MPGLASLPNIGEVFIRKLNGIGIMSYGDLVEIGSIEAGLRIGEEDSHAIPKGEHAVLKESYEFVWVSRGAS